MNYVNAGERFANDLKREQEQEEKRLHAETRAGKDVSLEDEPPHIRERIRERAAANLAAKRKAALEKVFGVRDAA